ncbi:MAG TPA: hypothetical protein VEB43_17170 [Anaeromyxobacter sp.]|nr:hypothetical protein [Anaeromyxobacter sp.]
MSDRRLRRFLHLERARPADRGAEPPREGADPTGERIAGVERPPAAAAAPPRARTGAQLDRFAADPEPRLELVDAEGLRPFTRCRRCGADNNVFATACTGCGIALDTAEQHAFDERFWAARQADADREARAEAERADLRARAEAEDARARRAMGEALAREVGDRERRRIDGWGGWRGRGGRSGEWNPLGLRLVRRIPDARWHIPVMAIASGLGASLAAYGIHAHSLFVFLLGAAALAVLLVHVPE